MSVQSAVFPNSNSFSTSDKFMQLCMGYPQGSGINDKDK